jgi:hypothetical protein
MMMKFFTTLTLALVLETLNTGNVVHAANVGPAAGDSATYSLQVQDSSVTVPTHYLNKIEVLSINPLLQSVNLQQTVTENNTVISQNAFDQALSDAGYVTTADVQNCAALTDSRTSATVESIRVKAGTFQSCHLKSLAPDTDGNMSDVYLGVVPFGTLKSSSTNSTTGASQVMELQSYRKN